MMYRNLKVFFVVVLIIGMKAHLFSQEQNPKLQIKHLSGDFYVFTTWQNYKGQPVSSNGLYFISEAGAVMIDTPWDTTQFQPLLDSIYARHKQKVVLCVATHSHEDRTGGLEFLRNQNIQTFTSVLTDSFCVTGNHKRAEFLFAKDTVFTVGQYSFQAFYAGAGHTTDNIVVWFAKQKILYGGCLIKSTDATDLGNIADANLSQWPKTLNVLEKKFSKPTFIIPGHQSWASTKSIKHTLQLLQKK